MQIIDFSEWHTLVAGILALVIGHFLSQVFSVFRRYSIPEAIVGGIFISCIILVLERYAGLKIQFSTGIRDILLLVFFVSIGLGARIKSLLAGGKQFVLLCFITVLLLFLQNAVGIAVAKLFGRNPLYGLLGGSVSFVGGPGTALAWSKEMAAFGLKGAEVFAISAATFAVVSGSMLGGPLITWLIKKYNLKSDKVKPAKIDHVDKQPETFTTWDIIRVLMIIAVSIVAGGFLKDYTLKIGLTIPGFLCALIISLLIGNLAGARMVKETPVIDRIGELSLQFFLAISLMGLKLTMVGPFLIPLLFLVLVQIALCFAVGYFILFPLLGRTYEAAIVFAGFFGFSISSMPVAMAGMEQLTKRYGPAPHAVLLITLCGSFFVDLANAVVVTLFLSWFK